MAQGQGRSVDKKQSVCSSNAVCTPVPWRFERRLASHTARNCGRACVSRRDALSHDARREDHRRRTVCIEMDHSSTWSGEGGLDDETFL
eukprot:5737663-Prymnesium_polylepis.1